jgi:DNA-binding beta-propeller fold protein YncE
MGMRDTRNKRYVAGGLILAVVSGLIIASGASGADKNEMKKMRAALRASGQSPYVSLMWPEPPQTTRIKAVDVLASEADLGRKITARESLMKFVTGATPTMSRIYQPRDVAVSDDGKRVYSSDFGQAAVFVFDFDKRKVTTIPSERPFGIALDNSENLYVAEQENKCVVVLDRQGNKLRTIASEKIIRPAGIAIDRERQLLYVADPARKASEEHSVKVFTLEGQFVRTIGNGKGDCQGCLLFPTYVAVDKAGNVYVTSTLNSRVDVFDAKGNYLKTIGERGNSFGMFDKPKGVAIDSFGNVYVVDSGWSNVQIFNQKGQVLLYFGGRGDYPGLLKNPTGIAIDRGNRIYVADYLNYRITIYQLLNTKAEDSFVATSEDGKDSDRNGKADAGRTTAAIQK